MELAVSGSNKAGSEQYQIYGLPRIGGLFHDGWYPHTTLWIGNLCASDSGTFGNYDSLLPLVIS